MWVDTDINLMYSEWLRLPSKKEYEAGVRESEELLISNPVHFWIMDSTKLAAMPLDDQKEKLRYMAHVMAKSELRKIARIVPKDNVIISFFEETLHEAILINNSRLEIDRFTTYKAAADWIGKISC